MAITPPSDIVLGVALAADPQKYRAAAERLRRLSAGDGTILDAPEWQASVQPQVQQDGATAAADVRPADPVASRAAGLPRHARGAPDAFGQLEAFVLQRFIQSMLPKNASHVFGKGTAGEIWKSMLAEKLGSEIAKSGQVGLAKRLQAGMATNRDGAVASSAAVDPLLPPPSLASVLPYLPGQVAGVEHSAGAAAVPSPSSADGAKS
jgi:Rod binding domain-containing protein